MVTGSQPVAIERRSLLIVSSSKSYLGIEVHDRARERPFGIRTTSGQSVRKTWRHLAEPVPVFLELARRGPSGKF